MSPGADVGGLRRDERSVSELLGALLVFGLLLIMLVLAQVTLVPTLNSQVEYEHSQRALDDLSELDASSSRVAATGASERTNVELGVTYPNRPLLINPGPVQGVAETTDPIDRGVVITNVSTGNPETDQYWQNVSIDPGVYETRFLTYEAQYREHRGGGRTVVEGGTVTYTRFESADVVGAGGPGLVDGRRIDLVVFGGDFQRISDGTDAVQLTPVSAPARTVSVRNETAPITITIKTFLEMDAWDDRLAAEAHVQDYEYTESGDPDVPSELAIVLEPGVTYELRMAKVGIGAGVDPTAAAYLTRESGAKTTVPTAGGEIAVDVRDAFNNPVAGTDVTFSITGGRAANLSTPTDDGQTVVATSTEDGRAVVGLSGDDSTVRVTATIEADGVAGTADYENVVFPVQIGSGVSDEDEGANDQINPNTREGNLVYVNATIPKQGNSDLVTAVFENTRNFSSNVTITDIRINFLGANAPGSSSSKGQAGPYAVFETPGRQAQELLYVGDTYTRLNPRIEVDDGELRTFTFDFKYLDDKGKVQDVTIQDGDFFVVTMEFAGDDQPRATYFLRVATGT